MELFGLKNKDGEEFSLLISNGETGKYELKSVNRLVEPEPKFKVGDWVIFESNAYYNIQRIKTFYRDYHAIDDDGCGLYLDLPEYRLATPQEIESHLKKICDEKYIGKTAKCLFLPADDDEIIRFKQYFIDGDKMWYNSKNGNEVCVYKQGEFAEILPQESKELPKTLEELVTLLYDFRDADKQPKHTVRDFIIKQGYKVD
jgi:hypothetical protein